MLAWLVPTLTGATLIHLAIMADTFWSGWGFALGLFHLSVGIMVAWSVHAAGKP